MKYLNIGLVALFLTLIISACGSSEESKRKVELNKKKIDELVKSLDAEKDYAIILYDMDIDGKKHKHKYKVLLPKGGNAKQLKDSLSNAQSKQLVKAEMPKDSLTAWHEVPERFFEKHANDMGMEIVSKVDNKLSKVATPAGYSHYVGNDKYGKWKKDNSGNSFWSFYGKYMFMSSMINMMSPISYGGYNTYYRRYRGSRPYYGSRSASGRTRYGTYSSSTRRMNPSYYKRASTNSALSSKVNNSISRSRSTTTAGKRSTSSSSRATSSSRTSSSSRATSSSRTSRSSSRYSGGSSSSSRSRSSSSGGK